MIVCNTLFFVSKIVFWRAQSFAGFLLERVLLAAVLSGISGVDTSIIYLSCGENNSHRAFGFFEGIGAAGVLFSAAVCSVFIGENYRLAGFLTVISYGIAAILSFGLKEVRSVQEASNRSLRYFIGVLKATLTDRRLLLLFVAVALITEVNQTVTVFFNQLQYTKAGMSARMISAVYILATLSGLLSVFSAPLTKKLKPKFFGAMLFAVCGISCFILALTENPFISVFGVLLVGVSFRLMFPLGTLLINKAITIEDRATALSMGTLIADITGVFTNLIFGKLADVNLSFAMSFGGILCLLGAVLYLRSLNNAKRSESVKRK